MKPKFAIIYPPEAVRKELASRMKKRLVRPVVRDGIAADHKAQDGLRPVIDRIVAPSA